MTDSTADPPRVARARLGVKNQLTLPKAIVDTLGARLGDTLVFRADAGAADTVQIQLVRRTYAGSMSGIYGTSEDVIAFLRGERAAWGD